MILDRHYIQDHSHKLLNVHPSMCLHTLPELPLLPQFRIFFFSKSEMAHIEPLLSTPVKWNQGSSYSLAYSQFASFILLDLMSFPLGHSHKRVFIDYFELASWIRTNNNKTRLEISWHQNQNSFCNTVYIRIYNEQNS